MNTRHLTPESSDPCQWIDDFLDDDLQPFKRAEFIEHLESCSSCREIVAQTRTIEKQLKQAWSNVALPEVSPIDDRVGLARADEATSRHSNPTRTIPTRKWASGIAIVLLLGLALSSLVLLQSNDRPVSDQAGDENTTNQQADLESNTTASVATGDQNSQRTVEEKKPAIVLSSDKSLARTIVDDDEFTFVELIPVQYTSTSSQAN